MLDTAIDPLDQILDGVRLIACWLKIGDKGKSIHNPRLYSFSATGSMGSRRTEVMKYIILGRDTQGRPFYTVDKGIQGPRGRLYFYITAHQADD